MLEKSVIERPTLPERRSDTRTGRREGAENRRSGATDRRIRKKFVLFDRRSGTGRRISAQGRRYCLERRASRVTANS